MSGNLAPILANFSVSMIEEKFDNYAKKPKHYFRYVEDTFAIFSSQDDIEEFHKLILFAQGRTFERKHK